MIIIGLILLIVVVVVENGNCHHNCIDLNDESCSATTLAPFHFKIGEVFVSLANKIGAIVLKWFPLLRQFFMGIRESASVFYKKSILVMLCQPNQTGRDWCTAFGSFRTTLYTRLKEMKNFLKNSRDCVLSDMVFPYVSKADAELKKTFDSIKCC